MAYPGGKAGAGVFQTLINLMPPHTVYVEPFLGGAAVMQRKLSAAVNIGLDLDPAVIDAALSHVAVIGGGTRSGSRSTVGGGGGGTRSRPKPTDSAAADPDGGNGGAGHPESSVAELSGAAGDAGVDGGAAEPRWRFIVGNGIDFLRSNAGALTADALVYCDPPYLHSTRVCTRHYTHEMTDLQHGELLEVLRPLRCRVMISGYSSPMYARALKGWNATAFQAATRGRPAAEWVWYNYDRPVELHDYRFLGNSRRERESIKRKQRRWVARLGSMPVLERQALLSAISEVGGTAVGDRCCRLS